MTKNSLSQAWDTMGFKMTGRIQQSDWKVQPTLAVNTDDDSTKQPSEIFIVHT